jgi:signal transduction histidine kinase
MADKPPSRDDAVTVRSPQAASLLRPLVHEVGNLLAAIRLSAHLLDGDEEQQTRTAREVESLAAQAGALLAQIRPLMEGVVAESRVRVTTESLLASVARAVEGEASDAVRLRIARGRGLPDVRIDPEALHHLLVTLVLGAIREQPGGGRVRVDAEARGRRVVLVLADEAPALDLRDARPEAARGRELALRLGSALLKACGGRIRVGRGRRGGNRIEVWLPALGSAAATRSRRAAPQTVRRGGPRRA